MSGKEEEIQIISHEHINDDDTMDLRSHVASTTEIPSSALINEFDPGVVTMSARPSSAASNHSSHRPRSWSSGKMKRAPPPPPSTSPSESGRRKSSAHHSSMSSISCHELDGPSRRSSCCSTSKLKSPKTRRERFRAFWLDPSKQRQGFMWLAFLVVVIVTVIMFSIVIARFSSGFGGNGLYEENDGEDWGYVEGKEQLKATTVNGDWEEERYIMLIGGKDEERQDSNEIVTREGVCHMVQGYPSPLPTGRSGHVAALANDRSAVIVCGGLNFENRTLSRQCWKFNPVSNEWTSIPGLKQAIRYGAATSVGNKMFVLGGTDNKGQKTNAVQVMNTNSYRWEEGPHLPQGVWGHCAATTPKGDIILTGGWTDRAVRSNMKNTLRYKMKSTTKGGWEILKPMNQGRATHGCSSSTIFKSKTPVVIVAGGMAYDHTPVAEVEVLLLSLDDSKVRWVELGKLSTPRAWYPAVGVLKNILVVAAGRGSNIQAEDTIETFDPKEKLFSATQMKLQWRREDGRAVMIPGKWYRNCVR